MSTRWYPLFQPGNPQLRVFLPNFWMKLVRGGSGQEDQRPLAKPNQVQFIVSMEMTRFDVMNYLKKIYNVDAATVTIHVRMGETKEAATVNGKMVVKEDDYKVAFVTLPHGQTFTFPDIYPKEKIDSKQDEDMKQMEQLRLGQEKLKNRIKGKPDLPGWFA